MSKMRRPDKFQLSGGRLIFAPRYPRWLEWPGYWDEIHYHDENLAPVFTYTILDKENTVVPLRFLRRSWWPGRSVSFYRAASHLDVKETRLIAPDDRSTLSILPAYPESSGTMPPFCPAHGLLGCPR